MDKIEVGDWVVLKPHIKSKNEYLEDLEYNKPYQVRFIEKDFFIALVGVNEWDLIPPIPIIGYIRIPPMTYFIHFFNKVKRPN